MTARIREFLKQRTDIGPCLVVDLDVVRENYQNSVSYTHLTLPTN